MKNCYIRLLSFMILFAAFYFTLFCDLHAQTFSITELNADEFPKIKCNFMALDSNGKSYQDVQKSDLNIVDGGFNVNPTIEIECADNTSVSVELVLDQSSSMDQQSGDSRWKWVVEGVTSFLNSLSFSQGTTAEIISFAREARVVCPFTNNRNSLIDSLLKIKVNGGTRYVPAFLDENNGAIPRLRKFTSPDIRRIIIFLTDGDPDASDETPVNTIVNEARSSNVQVYSITLSMPMNPDLADISAKTGGKSYAVYNKVDLDNIYKVIGLDIQNKQICKLSWIAPYSCSENGRYRDVGINFRGLNELSAEYTAPSNSIAGLTYPSYIYFGDPDVNTYTEREITLTATGADYTLNSADINPNTFFSVVDWNVGGTTSKPPFVIKKDESRTIRLRYSTGQVKSERQAFLMLNGNPCSYNIKLFGGYTKVVVVSPNGGEVYSICDTIDIKWTGVDEKTYVSLYYKKHTDGYWYEIADSIQGLHYSWVPPDSSSQYSIKAELTPIKEYKWAVSAGGGLNDSGVGVAITDDNMDAYIAGTFEGTASFDSYQVTAKKDKDMFIALYTADGKAVWARSGGSEAVDSAAGICVDNAGNAYVIGTCYQNARFGNLNPDMAVGNKPYCFIAKYAIDGTIVRVNTDIGASIPYPNFSSWGKNISFYNGQVQIKGGYSGRLEQTPIALNGSGSFSAVYDTDLNLISFDNYGYSFHYDRANNVDYDSDNNQYKVGTFSGTTKFGNINLTSSGANDVYLYKVGMKSSSYDVCDSEFTVIKPSLQFAGKSVDFGSCKIPAKLDSVVVGLLYNPGLLPLEITGAQISGDSDFTLKTQLQSYVLKPGDTISVEIEFSPKKSGVRKAQLKLSGVCCSDIYLDLLGSGVCSGLAMDTINMGSVIVNKSNSLTFTRIFVNTNYDTVKVQPVVVGSAEFTIFPTDAKILNPGDSLFLTITFNPISLGTKTAHVNFDLDSNCEVVFTCLIGEGISASLKADNLDFGAKRILTNNTGTVKLTNNTDYTVKVTDVKFEDVDYANSAKLSIAALNLPFTIEPNISYDVFVNFIPQMEKDYNTNLLIYIEGNAEPIKANIKGKGFLPKINLLWTCAKPVKPGDQSNATLEIKSSDASADLYVYTADFANNNGEYTWVSQKPQNVTIPAGQSKQYTVAFKPNAAGYRNNTITVTSDAAAGPLESPKVTQILDVQCEGLGVDYTKNIDFEIIMPCSELTLPMTIKNLSPSTALNISSYSFASPATDKQYFTVDLPTTLNIKPNSSKSVNITFKPKEIKSYSAKIIFTNDLDFDISCNLKGDADEIKYYSDKKEYEEKPGNPIDFAVFAKVPKFSDQMTEPVKLDLDILFNSKMLEYKNGSFSSPLLNQILWSAPNASLSGKLNVSGSGALTTPFDGKILEFKFNTYLGDTSKSVIQFHPVIEGCNTDTSDIGLYNTSGICFLSGRYITASNEIFALKEPEPNPASNSVKIGFSAAFQSAMSLDIFDAYGNRVLNALSQDIKAGSYDIELNLNDFTSGVYFVRYICGSYSKTVRMLINK